MTAITVEGTTATVGTGPVTIDPAPVSGYAAWNTMPAGVYPYALLDGRASESGWGGWDGVSVLTRIAITHSTNIGNPIALSGNAAIVVLQVSGAPQPGSAYVAKPPGVLLLSQVFAASGPVTILGPGARVKMRGAAGGTGRTSSFVCTGGSGAPGYLEKYLTGLVVNKTLTFTRGNGGAAGTGSGGAGGNGTASTLTSGTQAIATLTAGGSNGTLGGAASAGTPGGTATGGDLNVPGAPGQAGYLDSYTDQTSGFSAFNSFPGAAGVTPYAVGALGGANAGRDGDLAIDWYS